MVVEVDKVDRYAINDLSHSLRIARVEIDTRYGRHDFNPQRRLAHADNLVFLKEQFFSELLDIETELSDRRDRVGGVPRMAGHPDVQVDGRPWVAMIPDGIPADEQVLNAVGVQQL